MRKQEKTRLLAFVLVLALMLSCTAVLAGCSGKIDPTEEPSEKQTSGKIDDGTEVQTDEPSENGTEVPTENSTKVPTDEVTENPTEKPTESPILTPSEGLEYVYDDDEGVCVVSAMGTCTDKFIVVADTWNGYTVIGVNTSAFANNTEITGIVLPNSSSVIADNAFDGCTSLVSVTIPQDIEYIGERAFYGCTALKEIILPDTVSVIGDNAFDGCTSLAYNEYADVQYLGNKSNPYVALIKATKTNITSCQIHENTKYICFGAFTDCLNLTSISYSGTMEQWEKIYKRGWISEECGYTVHCSDGYIMSPTYDNDSNAIPKPIEDLYFAFDEDSDTYIVVDIGTYNGTDVIIPSEYNGKAVTGIGSWAFYDCKSLTSIIIPDSVTNIGDNAFEGCSGLTNITIPDGVTSIGNVAFRDCLNLTNMIIGNGVTSIGESAFYNCSSLTSITIPDGVTSIGDYAFGWCTSLTSITIPDSVTSIGDWVFSDCYALVRINYSGTKKEWESILKGSNWCDEGDNIVHCIDGALGELPTEEPTEAINGLEFMLDENTDTYIVVDIGTYTDTDVVIPSEYNGKAVTSIGDWAFYDCTSLTSITIPDSVTSIGSYAFYDCTSLTSITIPDSVMSIGWRTFCDCSSLESITLPFVGDSIKTSSDTYQYPFGYIFGTLRYTGFVAAEQYYYGSSTSSIAYNIYYIPESLKSVTITGGNILYGAFYGCSSLTSIKIPESVAYIDEYAFYGCSGIESINVAEENTQYHSDGNCIIETERNTIILGCKNSVIPTDGSVTCIGGQAFSGCSGLTSINIPDSVTSIGSSAFSGCSGLTSIVIPDSVTSIGYGVFGDCSKLTNVKIGSGVTIINGMFSGCSSLASIRIPDTVTSIGEYAFNCCSSLANVIIGNSVTNINYSAFKDCSGLEYNVYDNAKYLGNESNPYFALIEATRTDITSCQIHEDTKVIAEQAFEGCSSLTSITIGGSVTSINHAAFGFCTSLEAVYITDIAAWCGIEFAGGEYTNPLCYAHDLYLNDELVTELVIPDGVTSIGEWAFYNCSSLTSITIPDSVTSIGNSAFKDCPSLTSITISDSVTSVCWEVFSGCSSLMDIYYSGTKEHWDIMMCNWFEWDRDTGEYTVHCTDGDLTKAYS